MDIELNAIVPAPLTEDSRQPETSKQRGQLGDRVVKPRQTESVTYKQICFAFCVVSVVGFCLLAMTFNMGDGPRNEWLRSVLGYNSTSSN